MTLQSLSVLLALRRCTRFEGTPVFVDPEEHRFAECEPDAWSRKYRFKPRSARIPVSDSSLDSVLDYLNETGMIDEPDDYITLTHSGFHFRQTLFFGALTFLAHSVLLPIIVAFLTSLAVYYFGGLLGLPAGWVSG